MPLGFELFSQSWAAWMWAQFWQSAVLIALAAIVDRLLRPLHWPQLRLAVWMLVLIKLVVPPQLASPLSVSAGWLNYDSVPFLFTGLLDTAGLGQRWTTPTLPDGGIDQAISIFVASVLFAIWLTGVTIIALAFAWRYRRLSQMCAQDRAMFHTPAWLGSLVAEHAAALRLARPPTLTISPRVFSPAVFGLLSPTVLIPLPLARRGRTRDLELMILHELSHLRRGDLWWQSFTQLVQMAYWFHPLVYWVCRRTYNLRELCCDASVAAALRRETPAYRETLIRAVAALLRRPAVGGSPVIAGLLDNSDNIIERVRHLHDGAWRWHRWRCAGGLAAGAIAMLTVIPMGREPLPERCRKSGCRAASHAISDRELSHRAAHL